MEELAIVRVKLRYLAGGGSASPNCIRSVSCERRRAVFSQLHERFKCPLPGTLLLITSVESPDNQISYLLHVREMKRRQEAYQARLVLAVAWPQSSQSFSP
jgi:hypothetical protein